MLFNLRIFNLLLKSHCLFIKCFNTTPNCPTTVCSRQCVHLKSVSANRDSPCMSYQYKV